MNDLEKLVRAFASGLCIKSRSKADVSKATYIPASESTKETFKVLMTMDLEKSLSKCNIESAVRYDYTLGKLRGANLEHKGALTLFVSKNLQDIFEGLPKLAEGEEYAFLSSMVASIKVLGLTKDRPKTKVEKCSIWIASAMAAM